MIEVIQDDCLKAMREFPDKSFDMILCDLPYGTTACSWDTVIPFEPLWEQYKRIIKDNGAIVLTASQPFTSALVMSNPKWFRYEWIWKKETHSNFLNIKKQPGKRHENILVFYLKQPIYNPQFWEGEENHAVGNNVGKSVKREIFAGAYKLQEARKGNQKYPISIIEFNSMGRGLGVHPTQKPVALFEYLIKTYTNEGDRVLDNCAGSGTTGVACHNLKRECVLIEREPKYVEIIKKRLADLPPTLF